MRKACVTVLVVSTTPSYLTALVDDAAVFPPARTPLSEAVASHVRHRRAAYSAFVGPFVIGSDRLHELPPLVVATDSATPLSISVVCAADTEMITAAVRAAATADRLSLAALELRLAAADLPGQVRQSAATCESLRRDGILDRDVMVFAEAPRRDPQRASQCDAALEAAAEAGVRLKFRTGGVAAEAFPSEQELAGAIVAAVSRGVPFKCTAGLHNAARHRDAATGFEHHGFLNVLLATSLAVEGAATADLSAMLAEVDGATLASQVRSAGTAALADARHWFISFGACSVAEPLADLAQLGLLPQPTTPAEAR